MEQNRISLEGGLADGHTRWDRGTDQVDVNGYVYRRTDCERGGLSVFEYLAS